MSFNEGLLLIIFLINMAGMFYCLIILDRRICNLWNYLRPGMYPGKTKAPADE